MNTYIVIKERNSEFPNPINVRKNKEVVCVRESEADDTWTGWILCRTLDNEGWIPKQFIRNYDGKGIKKSNPNKLTWTPLDHLKSIY